MTIGCRRRRRRCCFSNLLVLPITIVVLFQILALALAHLSAHQDVDTADHHAHETNNNNQTRKPNILLFLTDDQDVLLGGIEHMPLLHRYLVREGMTFEQAFVHTPICCSSRSSILTGRYIHNGGALNNSMSGNCYGTDWKQHLEHDTFAMYAKQYYGYQTAYLGKYLNAYGLEHDETMPEVPPGWDKWLGLVGNSVYYNYETILSNDGGQTIDRKVHKSSYHEDYPPDLIANRTIELIHEFSAGTHPKQDPFLIVTAWPTPHSPFTPAPQDERIFDQLHAYRTPNYNTSYEQNLQKHWFMRQLAPIDEETAKWIDHTYQLRHEAVRSIDRHIELFIHTLEHLGQLNNTFILYTSDNGFQLGQHRLRGDKRQLYEHDIRVPFVIRGPDVPPNSTNKDLMILNIDIAPTIVDIVSRSSSLSSKQQQQGQEQESTTIPFEHMDGTSFLPLLQQQQPQRTWRTDFLISYHGEGSMPCGMYQCPSPKVLHGGDCFNNTYHCVRTLMSGKNNIYCHFDDNEQFVEYYDLTKDPWQLVNAVDELLNDEKFELQARLEQFKQCQGPTCRRRLHQHLGSYDSTSHIK